MRTRPGVLTLVGGRGVGAAETEQLSADDRYDEAKDPFLHFSTSCWQDFLVN